MSYGKIYETTWWGNPVKDGWGGIYYDLQTSQSFALDFAKIATDFTFTRSSFATRVNENGLIETVTDLGSELVTNGTFDTDSDWTKGTGASISGGKLVFTSVNALLAAQQSSVLTVGKVYFITYTIDSISSGAVLIRAGDVAGKTRTSAGTYTEALVADNTYLRFSSASGATTATIDNVSVKEVLEDDVPRIDYSTGEAAFLLEPQSTNLIPYSEDFTDASWLKFNETSITPNVEISPDGTLNASKISGISSLGRFATTITVTPSTTYTVSFWVKNISITNARMIITNTDVGTFSYTYTSQLEVGVWKRVEYTFTTGAGILTQIQFFRDLNSSSLEAYIWGAQLEALPYATSYIPTNGTTVTRAAETCVDATPTINSEEGVIFLETKPLSSTDRGIIALGNDSNVFLRIYIDFNNVVNDRLKVSLYDGTSTQFNFITTLNNSSSNKIAVKYKTNDFALWVNGIEVATDSLGNTYSAGTLNELSFATTSNHVVNFYGRTKDLKIYTKALSDSELEELTTI